MQANAEKSTQKLFKDVVSRLGLEPRTLALKGRTDGYTQWLDIAKVSPFYLANQGVERFLLIRLILTIAIYFAEF